MKNVHRVSTKQWGHEIRRFAIQKRNHFASSVCYCIVLLENVKVQLSLETRKCNCFARFAAATVKLQEYVINEPGFTIGAG